MARYSCKPRSDFTDELAPEEERYVSVVATSQSILREAFTKKLTQEIYSRGPTLTDSSHPHIGLLEKMNLRSPFWGSFRRIFFPSLGWALVVTVAVVAIFTFYRRPNNDSLATVNQLLAEAYTQQRTVPLRIPGAGFGPLRITRGGTASRLDRPGPLLDAEAKIASVGPHRQRDFGWLIASARADLIEGNYDAAIRSLQQAQVLQPTATEAYLDLATAYFERAQMTGMPADLSAAEENIAPVLEKSPDDPIALFNRALIYEQMFCYSKAAMDWEHYLTLDSTGKWAEEAREHLSDVNRRLEEKKNAAGHAELLEPDDLLLKEHDPVADDEIDSRIEEYQQAVFRLWLPRLVEQRRHPGNLQTSGILRSIARISNISIVHHADRSLVDFSESKRLDNPRLMKPIECLSLAIIANQSGDEHRGFVLAKQANVLFQRAGLEQGAIRAQFEQIYALQFSNDIKRCLALARSVAVKSHRYGYPWLESESLMEEGFCANMGGNLAIASKALREAKDIAARSHYEEAEQRALVGAAAMQWEAGSQSATWKYLLDGLQRYWEHPVSDVRGISIYALMDFVAEESRQWHTQAAALEETVRIAEEGRDRLYLAHTLSRRAGCELMLQERDQAQHDLSRAVAIFNAAPQTEATQKQELLVEINVAKAELDIGDYQESLKHLRAIRAQVDALHESLSRLDYYSAFGEALRKTGAWSQADGADRQAVVAFQAGLASLRDPRDRLAWYRRGSRAYRSFVQLKLNLKDPGGALKLWDSYRNAVSGPLLSKGDDLPETTMASGADSAKYPNSTTLVYAALPDGLFAWALTGDQIEAVQIGRPVEEVRQISTVFSNQCSDPSSDLTDLSANGNALFRDLIAPFSKFLSRSALLIIAPDEDLATLPFDALVDDQGRYLNATYQIIAEVGSNRASSGIHEPLLSRRDPIMFAIAANSPGLKAAPDPLAAQEVEEIGRLFDTKTIFTEYSSSKKAFKTLLSSASIFHYAGHSGTTVQGGALFAGTDSGTSDVNKTPFSSSDVDKRALRRCRLVVLSACETDQGRDGLWLDRENLAISFINAGVPVVIATRWKVDSAATGVVMKKFYKYLVSGNSPATAMRSSVEETRSIPAFCHPYYWAGFSVLVGVPAKKST